NTKLTGAGTDTLVAIEAVALTGGPGNNLLDASAFTLGPVTLDGAGGNDILKGGAGGDQLTGGAGEDSLVGGAGTNRGGEAAGGDVDFTLAPAGLPGAGTVTPVSVEGAVLSGGGGDNPLEATAFAGPVTLAGSGGKDTLKGGTSDDVLTGGPGDDSLVGGAG